ncbi:MAG: acylpyruvase [Rhodothermaceae bacterium]|nr:MAG: acylpyruvase [Rhodothermaceae bacterium]
MIDLLLPPHGQDVRVGKILCIGRNYAKHAAEMQSDVPDEPLVFLKPSTALVGHGGTVLLPPQSQDVHHEVELVAVMGRGGKNIPESRALEHVAAYAVGLDMTARDLQALAKKKGHPWTVAKGFDTFAPLGPLVDASQVRDPQALEISLTVNGDVRQHGHTRDMIFPVARLIAYCSQIFTLMPGDLLYTGTPEGVGPVQDGDVLEARISGFPSLRVRVRRAA